MILRTLSKRKSLFSFRLQSCNYVFVKENGSGSSLDNFLSFLRENNFSFNSVVQILSNQSEDYKFFQVHIKPKLELLQKLGVIKK